MYKDRLLKSPETFSGVSARRATVHAATVSTVNALIRYITPEQPATQPASVVDTQPVDMSGNWTATNTAPDNVKVIGLMDRQNQADSTSAMAHEQELARLRRAVEEA